jgi:hypothetical protein
MVMARRNANKNLSDGVVVEASVVARLLGIKLLRVNAHVTLMPSGGEPITYLDTRVAEQPAQLADGGSLSEAVNLLAHASQTMHDAKRLSS